MLVYFKFITCFEKAHVGQLMCNISYLNLFICLRLPNMYETANSSYLPPLLQKPSKIKYTHWAQQTMEVTFEQV